MAKKTIRGITVQIGGDTSGLTKALDKADSALNATRRELREVEKGLKFDPGNTKLIAQQQEVLQKAIKESADKLHMLEDAQEKVDEAFKKGEISPEQYREYEREVELTQDSHSPSKEFNKLGDYAVEGYALGFKDEETAVQRAARQMAEDAIKAVEAVNKAGLKAPQGFADSIKESMASANAAKSGLQSTAKSLLTPTPPAKQEVIVKMPETIVTKSYLYGRQIAENQASYLDSIYLEPLAEEFELSHTQIKAIVRKC